MPKYKFQWSNLSRDVLKAVCRELALGDGDPAAVLQAAYGARPQDSFVHDAWPVLLERWLVKDTEARQQIVSALWQAGVGKGGPFPSDRAAELAYLRDRNSTARLRQVVLDTFIAWGESPAEQEAGGESATAATAVRGCPTSASPPPTTPDPSGAPRSTATLPPPTPPSSQSLPLASLERRLWDAANALRGPVDPADFKTYVFPMLFWKWISDSWDYEHAQAVEDYGDDIDDEVEAD